MNKFIKSVIYLSLSLFFILGGVNTSITCKAENKDSLKFFMSICDDGSTLCGFNFIYENDTLFVSEPIEISKDFNFERATYYSDISDFKKRIESFENALDKTLYGYHIYGKETSYFNETNCKYEIFLYDKNEIVYSIKELKEKYGEIEPAKIKSNFKSQITNSDLYAAGTTLDKYMILCFNDNQRRGLESSDNFQSEILALTHGTNVTYIDVSAFYLYWLYQDFECMKYGLVPRYDNKNMIEYDFTNNFDYSRINHHNDIYFSFSKFKQINTGSCERISLPAYSHCIEENTTVGADTTKQFCKPNYTYISIPHKFIININQYNIKDKVYKNKEVVMYNNGPNGNAVLNESLYKLPNVNSTSEYYTFEGYEIVSDSLNIKTSLSDYTINPDKEFLLYSDSYETPQITVKEIFKPIEVKVNIDCNNYNFDINTPSVIWDVEKEEKYATDYTKLLPDSSAKDYKFVGYYTDLSTNSDGSISFSNKNKITSLKSIIDIKNDKSITIYPGFVKDSSISEEKTFTISFKDNLFPSISVKEGEALTNLPTPIIENSTFTGWNTEDGTSIDNGYIPTSDIILYPTFSDLNNEITSAVKDEVINNNTTTNTNENKSDNLTTTLPTKDTKISTEQVSLTPSKIAKVKVKNVKGKKAKITWKKNNKSKTYEIQICLKKNFKKGIKTYKTAKTSYTIKKLKKGKTYYVRVRAINDNVVSSWSKTVKVKIKK